MVGAQLIANSLKELGDVDEIDIHVNSNGGSVFEGFAIYNLIKNHSAKVTMHVEGIAASAASTILMAGDKIVMAQNAYIMIHDPSSYAWGNSADLRKTADMLDNIKEQVVAVYASRSGKKTEEEFAQLMADETWFTASQAVEAGLADEINKNKSAVLNSACDVSRIPEHVLAFLQPERAEEAEPEAESPVVATAEPVAMRLRLAERQQLLQKTI